MHELEQPRLLVLGNYPFSPYKVGDVIKVDEKQCFKITEEKRHEGFLQLTVALELYPNLFRLLEWHEYRKLEEMPKYVKHKIIPKEVRVVLLYTIDGKVVVKSGVKMSYNSLLPATEDEYKAYTEKLNK